MGHPLWPLFDIRLRTPDLELRVPLLDDLPALCEAAHDIHDQGYMPFAVAWTDQPSPQFERSFLQWWTRHISGWTPASWDLPFAVFVDGRPVGVQGLHADDFVTLRTVSTGSWLTRAVQGRGHGKQMRTAVLELAFRGLGAAAARSAAFADNAASIAVSRALGYRDNGVDVVNSRGTPGEQRRFVLGRDDWRPACAVDLRGLDGCLDMFGSEGTDHSDLMSADDSVATVGAICRPAGRPILDRCPVGEGLMVLLAGSSALRRSTKPRARGDATRRLGWSAEVGVGPTTG